MRTISFEAVDPSLNVRVTEDDLMVALDLFSVLTRRDRKKASQTLARIGTKPDTSTLLTFKHLAHKKHPRKLISFANAIKLLLIVPKRTASIETRKIIADVLVAYFERGPSPAANPLDTDAELPVLERRAAVLKTTVDIERQRMQLPLEQIKRCMELMEKCAPLTAEETAQFKLAISTHMLKLT